MKAERKERKMPLSGWVIVGLLDMLAGMIAGELVAFWALPYSYNWRGYMAIGGEWILIFIATAGVAMWMHSLLMDWIFGGKKDGKVRSVSPSSHRSGGNRGRVRREVLRPGVREEAQITCKMPSRAAQNRHSA